MEPKYFFAKVKSINENERTIDAIASTTELDRDEEIVLPSAFRDTLQSFKDNPVILAQHQHRLSTGSSPVIGSAIPESIYLHEFEIPFTVRFAKTPLGEEYWNLYKDKHMRAFSIGFTPLVGETRTIKGKSAYCHTKAELLEISAVPVPSNRRALARMKGYFENEEIKDTIADVVKEQNIELQKNIEQMLEEIKSLIIVDRDGLAQDLLGSTDASSTPDDEQKNSELKNLEKIEDLIQQIAKE